MKNFKRMQKYRELDNPSLRFSGYQDISTLASAIPFFCIFCYNNLKQILEIMLFHPVISKKHRYLRYL